MNTVLVTGANGFVGSHVVQLLSEQQDLIVIAACRDKSKLLPSFNGEIREGDFQDQTYLTTLFDNVDIVINAMAWTSLWGSAKQSTEMYLQPSLNFIEAFKQSNAHKFINISTSSASAPQTSHDASSPGIPRSFWPHLNNVIKIENQLRNMASSQKTVINMRLGIFAGQRYSLGLLPILVPRLKTHLVPWVAGGKTTMPIIDGRDIAQALMLAAIDNTLINYNAFNVIGPSKPTVRQVIEFLCKQYNLPKPYFGVPFFIAYPFAWLMEKLDSIVPWEPLIVRSIIHLLEETNVNNDKVTRVLGYHPKYNWKDTVRLQMDEMHEHQKSPMKMTKPIH